MTLQKPQSVTMLTGPGEVMRSRSVAWALQTLLRALEARGCAVTQASTPGEFSIRVTTGSDDTATRVAQEAAVTLPHTAEGFALLATPAGIVVWGFDLRGLVYGLTELADRARYADAALFGSDFPLVEQPTARIRSIARLFCSEEEDKPWFHDRQFWHEYLDMLASNRFNRFALTLGMGYNYPYHNHNIRDVYFYFPYPFLLDVSGYGVDVAELTGEERDANLETLKFIGRETARRGLDFQLALWTQHYDFDDVPNANYTVRGVTTSNLAPYCRDAITALLRAVPEITGLTFRVHVEGGIAEGDYGFWEHAFAGVAAVGRPVEIDMHGKGLDHRTIGIARDSGMPITASPKYLAEHMGLPYHQSAIRAREYPPETASSEREQLSTGSRKFLRYSYGDLLSKDRDWKVLYRIWAGTQRVLLWGDPALAAGYGRSSGFCGSDGVEWCEPGSFKGRMGTGVPGQRFNYIRQGLATRYDWQKYAYLYRVWGRLLFNPEASRDSWMRYLRQTCGDAAEACEKGLGFASRVLPLITLAHGPSASNNFYWPEIYTNLPVGTIGGSRAFGRDMDAPVRFGNAPSFDPQLISTPREYAKALHDGATDRRFTPCDVADWLDQLADGSDAALATLRSSAAFPSAEVQRVAIDVAILSGIARFFAAKFRASVWTELFVLANASLLLDEAQAWLNRAVIAWEGIVDVSRDTYHEDLTYGPQSWLRRSWQSRQQDIRDEANDIRAMGAVPPHATVYPDARMQAAIAVLRARRPTRSNAATVGAPASFKPGEPVDITAALPDDADAMLHYRHVNQAEHWCAIPMTKQGDHFTATIPAEYTDSLFHLQFYVSSVDVGEVAISPGFNETLSNEPYRVILNS